MTFFSIIVYGLLVLFGTVIIFLFINVISLFKSHVKKYYEPLHLVYYKDTHQLEYCSILDRFRQSEEGYDIVSVYLGKEKDSIYPMMKVSMEKDKQIINIIINIMDKRGSYLLTYTNNSGYLNGIQMMIEDFMEKPMEDILYE